MSNISNRPTTAFILSLIGGIFVLLVGLMLAVIGAALGIAWRPQMVEPPQWVKPTQTMNLHICNNCGRAVDPNARFCPACGKELPT